MRFWDSSAVVPLLVEEPSSAAMRTAYRQDPTVVAWWGTGLELVSALARREREGRIDALTFAEATRRLDALERSWREVAPLERVREVGVRLLRTHALRAADALQLGAAIVAAEERPSTLSFVTLDARLAQAAAREGFPVTMPA